MGVWKVDEGTRIRVRVIAKVGEEAQKAPQGLGRMFKTCRSRNVQKGVCGRCCVGQVGFVRSTTWVGLCEKHGMSPGVDWGSQGRRLPQHLVIFPAGFPKDFQRKPAGKVRNGNQKIMGRLATSCQWEWIAKHSRVQPCSGMVGTLRTSYNHYLFSVIVTLNSH